MILIWGTHGRTTYEADIFDHACPICSAITQKVVSLRKWFTFFFMPIFPISKKQYYLECLSCENCFKVKNEFISELLKEATTEKQTTYQYNNEKN